MRYSMYRKNLKVLLIFIISILVSGCSNMVLMVPKGKIGVEQRSLILTSLGLMLIVVIPVIIMVFFFIIKYRASNIKSKYRPDWSYSNKIELVVWIIPIIIIVILSALTWKSTYNLDTRKVIYSNIKPINIQVVSLDWKWLFIYPEYGIATINEIAFPVNVPIKFEITSNSVMNSFFIPQIGSQVYAMAGMKSNLYLISNESGKYKGISSNFSGQGFSGMKFTAIVTSNKEEFYKWIKKVKVSLHTLITIDDYNKLEKPSEYNSVKYFSDVKDGLFKYIIKKFMIKK